MSRSPRNIAISVFVVAWIALFHYESLRANYLDPLAGRPLPKFKFLYPPAGWIMFFNVDQRYGFAEVYGLRDGQAEKIDPHKIFATRFIGYDNIRRNVMISVVSSHAGPRFCAFLHRKFPEYQTFAVVYGEYSDVEHAPDQARYAVAYRCE